MERENLEQQEIAHIRKNRPSLGVEDLPEVEQLGQTIADTVSEMIYQYASEAAVKRVYICGSFARGDATAVISDLDVRVVLDQGLDLFVLESIQEELKNEMGFEIIPDQCGFLDPLIDTKDPEDSPSVLIWESNL